MSAVRYLTQRSWRERLSLRDQLADARRKLKENRELLECYVKATRHLSAGRRGADGE